MGGLGKKGHAISLHVFPTQDLKMKGQLLRMLYVFSLAGTNPVSPDFIILIGSPTALVMLGMIGHIGRNGSFACKLSHLVFRYCNLCYSPAAQKHEQWEQHKPQVDFV